MEQQTHVRVNYPTQGYIFYYNKEDNAEIIFHMESHAMVEHHITDDGMWVLDNTLEVDEEFWNQMIEHLNNQDECFTDCEDMDDQVTFV